MELSRCKDGFLSSSGEWLTGNDANLDEAYKEMAERLRVMNRITIIALGITKIYTPKGSRMSPIVEKVLIEVFRALLTDGRIEDGKQAVLEFLSALAAKTPTELDDYAVELLGKILSDTIPA